MNKRQYYIDWLRMALIVSVFFYHVGMVFNGWGWHIKNDVQFEVLNPVMDMLHSWRMPLLFLVSGAGTRFALGFRSKRNYLAERTQRLLFPVIFGIFVLVPVQVYIERISSYSTLWEFYEHFFDGVYPQGNFSWHHLWFIVYLYFISIVFLPYISFFRSRYYSSRIEPRLEKLSMKKGGLTVFFVPLLISQILLRPYFPEETHAFYNDWAYMSLFFIYFLLGFSLLGNITIVHNIRAQRRIWLGASILVVVIWGALFEYSTSSFARHVQSVVSLLMGWLISLCVLGYGQQYLNKDHPLRKPLNQAIYPFYLIHQPLIIVFGFWVIAFPLASGLKALFMTIGSLVFFKMFYSGIVLKSRYLGFCFGIKKK